MGLIAWCMVRKQAFVSHHRFCFVWIVSAVEEAPGLAWKAEDFFWVGHQCNTNVWSRAMVGYIKVPAHFIAEDWTHEALICFRNCCMGWSSSIQLGSFKRSWLTSLIKLRSNYDLYHNRHGNNGTCMPFLCNFAAAPSIIVILFPCGMHLCHPHTNS